MATEGRREYTQNKPPSPEKTKETEDHRRPLKTTEDHSGAPPKKPQDMTDAAFWKGMTDDKLRATITKGKPGSAMRAFPMKPEPLSDLVAYLNTLKPDS